MTHFSTRCIKFIKELINSELPFYQHEFLEVLQEASGRLRPLLGLLYHSYCSTLKDGNFLRSLDRFRFLFRINLSRRCLSFSDTTYCITLLTWDLCYWVVNLHGQLFRWKVFSIVLRLHSSSCDFLQAWQIKTTNFIFRCNYSPFCKFVYPFSWLL